MEAMILKKEEWPSFIGQLAALDTWVPGVGDNCMHFMPLVEGINPENLVHPTRVPPKNFLFPQTETLYRFKVGENDVEVPAIMEERILLGVKPCDARAMAIVEKLFRWGIDDPYYLAHKEQTTIIAQTCAEPGINCFCPSVGGGPASKEGVDLLLTDLGDQYLFEPLNKKGNAILTMDESLFIPAGKKDMDKKYLITEASLRKIRRQVDHSGVPEKLLQIWDDPLWEKVSSACLGCGICTYLCPTCHCFDIQDEMEGFYGRRCRMWDSCMFEEYTRHTSGHNPRPTRLERTRNRINHKFSYYVGKFDQIACVGCGRCTDLCPVNIDLVEILMEVKEALE